MYTKVVIFLLFLSTLPLSAQDFIKVKAQKGDGIFKFLRRYNLLQESCNLKKFYTLNKLKKNDNLQQGKSYILPIYVYKFNGKSIRSTINIRDYNLAKDIERYNDEMLEIKLKKENFRKGKRSLWVPYHFKACPNDINSLVPKKRKYNIFGEKYASVKLVDRKLAGAVYYLVSGHGGPDPGAIAKYKGKQICEDEYAYDITLRLARNLTQHGAIVYLITRDKNDGIRNAKCLPCDTDETVWKNQAIPQSQKPRLIQRSTVINNLYKQNLKKGARYQRMIEIHVDSRSKSERIDLFFYHYPKNLLANKMANKLHQTFKSKYAIHRRSGQYHGSVKERDLHMIREVIPPSVFVEVANIQNKNDQQRIILSSNRQTLADWLTEGIIKDY